MSISPTHQSVQHRFQRLALCRSPSEFRCCFLERVGSCKCRGPVQVRTARKSEEFNSSVPHSPEPITRMQRSRMFLRSKFLDDFLLNRIGCQVLLGHFLACRAGQKILGKAHLFRHRYCSNVEVQVLAQWRNPRMQEIR